MNYYESEARSEKQQIEQVNIPIYARSMKYKDITTSKVQCRYRKWNRF